MSYKDYIYFKFNNSSVLDSCAWAQDLNSLIIVFNSGAIWLYSCDQSTYEELINSKSAGNYFNLNIRNTFNGELVYKVGSYNDQKA
jgi:hypothetical protein